MSKVSDLYEAAEFEDLLECAEQNASGDWAMNFVDDMSARYSEHGTNMFLSERQDEVLRKIAHRD